VRGTVASSHLHSRFLLARRQSEQGWVRFEGRSTIVIHVPYPGPAILPPELVTRVGELLADPAYEQSFVCIAPHSLTQPANIREVLAGFTGALVCPDCMTPRTCSELCPSPMCDVR
jgi:hypothetical protein